VLRRREAEVAHEARSARETPQIADLGDERRSDDDADSAQGLQSAHHRRESWLLRGRGELVRELLQSQVGVHHLVEVVFEDLALLLDVEALAADPVDVPARPGALHLADPAVTQQEARELLPRAVPRVHRIFASTHEVSQGLALNVG
jgi:hypothetical protein